MAAIFPRVADQLLARLDLLQAILFAIGDGPLHAFGNGLHVANERVQVIERRIVDTTRAVDIGNGGRRVADVDGDADSEQQGGDGGNGPDTLLESEMHALGSE
jgi:hypothetical protein